MIFFKFLSKKYFLFFFAEFKLLMFHNNIVKISEKLNKTKLNKLINGFALNNDKGLHIYFSDFLKNVEGTVVNFHQTKKYDFFFCFHHTKNV